ncbi:hypothetical protein MXMO3_02508 [Maritalea myrionectae]|uniref:Uncharacterized protein n=1 Tax=Maritalea myrionectae TaxID=454601 RepID=A0A2R4MG85_9HYPH|nr:hypothetical protein MXMO3_02508 [Maritalea myrionectae]
MHSPVDQALAKTGLKDLKVLLIAASAPCFHFLDFVRLQSRNSAG